MESPNEPPNIVGDRLNVLLLTSLFVVQFIPRNMMDAISFTLQRRNVSYADQVRDDFHITDLTPRPRSNPFLNIE